MKYSIYKLEFHAGVHFGNGMLNDSEYTFRADVLFSAMYIEALKLEKEKIFLESVKSGQLLFSDAFPYVGDQYMIPKPMLYIEAGEKGDSNDKKAYKQLKYFPVEQLEKFLKGTMDLSENPMSDFGTVVLQTMASVRNDQETLPYHVGTFYYGEGNGLYIIVAYEEEYQIQLAEELIEAVSYMGIGGKKANGLGKFTLKRGKKKEALIAAITKESHRKMLLSCGLPREDELEYALEGASYLLEKRSGFVFSDTYSEEQRKKKDLYVFAAGSCFTNCFTGDVFDVSSHETHPVYRYAKPLFMGV